MLYCNSLLPVFDIKGKFWDEIGYININFRNPRNSVYV